MINTIKIFDINFIDEEFKIIKKLLDKGGLLVLPSGPGLCKIKDDAKYYKSLKNADLVLFDSGYLCLLLKVLKGINVNKFSGYKFFKNFIESINKKKKQNFFLIDPSHEQSLKNKKFFKMKKINKVCHYVAPVYKKDIRDLKLLNIIKKKKPKYVIINLGGGTQEILGYYLKKNLRYKPSIICSGAAISFFTKEQAPLNNFLDNIYLGWLIRIIFNPLIFLPRYLSAFKLFFIVLNAKIIK